MALKCPVCGKEAEKTDALEYQIVGKCEHPLFSGPLPVDVKKTLQRIHGINFKDIVEKSREYPENWVASLPSAQCRRCKHTFPITKETEEKAEK